MEKKATGYAQKIRRISLLLVAVLLCGMLLPACSGEGAGEAKTDTGTDGTTSGIQTEQPEQTDQAKQPEQTDQTKQPEQTEPPTADENIIPGLPESLQARMRNPKAACISEFRDHTIICNQDQLDINSMSELAKTMDEIAIYLPGKAESEPVIQKVQIGNCTLGIEYVSHYDWAAFVSASAYGQTVYFDFEVVLGFYHDFNMCVINTENAVLISFSGNTYVLSAEGVNADLHAERPEKKDGYWRDFTVEDGKIRCHRYPQKFRYFDYVPDRDMTPPKKPNWITSEPHFRFCGYGELWSEWSDVEINGDGAPVYSVTELITVDEAFAVKWINGKGDYNRYNKNILDDKVLEKVKYEFAFECKRSLADGYEMVK